MKIYCVAYALTAALAVYRTVKNMRKRKVYTHQAMSYTTYRARRLHFDLIMGYSVDTGTVQMVGMARLATYSPVAVFTSCTSGAHIKDKVNEHIKQLTDPLTLTLRDGNMATYSCSVFAGVSILDCRVGPAFHSVHECYVPRKLTPKYQELQKALAKLPEKIYV